VRVRREVGEGDPERGLARDRGRREVGDGRRGRRRHLDQGRAHEGVRAVGVGGGEAHVVEAGGGVVGVVAAAFSSKANQWVRETIVVPKWEDRLLRLIALGDGYVALPGGTGTLAELAVAWEMIHKRLAGPKPLVALRDFWRPIIGQIEFPDGNSRGLVQVSTSVREAVAALSAALLPGSRAAYPDARIELE